MKVWRCECWVHVLKEQDVNKLNPRAVENIFIDYIEDPSQYLVWLPKRKKVIKATNLIFIKDEIGQQRMPEQPRILEPAELGGAQ